MEKNMFTGSLTHTKFLSPILKSKSKFVPNVMKFPWGFTEVSLSQEWAVFEVTCTDLQQTKANVFLL